MISEQYKPVERSAGGDMAELLFFGSIVGTDEYGNVAVLRL